MTSEESDSLDVFTQNEDVFLDSLEPTYRGKFNSVRYIYCVLIILNIMYVVCVCIKYNAFLLNKCTNFHVNEYFILKAVLF